MLSRIFALLIATFATNASAMENRLNWIFAECGEWADVAAFVSTSVAAKWSFEYLAEQISLRDPVLAEGLLVITWEDFEAQEKYIMPNEYAMMVFTTCLQLRGKELYQ